jgi:hypothetical protein
MNTGKESLIAAVLDSCKSEGGDGVNFCHESRKCRCCQKYKWIMDRAAHYAEKLGSDVESVLKVWEGRRDYWFMNYYQDADQPLIEGEDIRVMNAESMKAVDLEKGFRCPCCNGISKDAYECDSGIVVKNIKDGKDGVCNWKSYGLFRTLGKGITIVMSDSLQMTHCFMPICWEAK